MPDEQDVQAEQPAPPLRLVVADDGRFVGMGRTDFVPGDGQRVIEVDDDHAAAFVAVAEQATGDDEITYDERAGRFATRQRVKTQAERDRDTTRALMVQAASGAAGVNIAALTAGQRNALLAVLLFNAGALDSGGVVLPLGQWAR